jgi:hypothetical protein
MKRIALVALALVAGCSSDPETKDTSAKETSPVEECPVTTSGPTVHSKSEIVGNEVWTAANSPHVVEYDINIRSGAKLTIEPCAVVQVKAGRGIRVAYPLTPNTGELVAEGTEKKPIKIVGFEGATWDRIYVNAPGKASLKYVNIENGKLVYFGDGTLPSKKDVLVDHVTIKKGMAKLDRGAAFAPGSTQLSISGSDNFPIEIGEQAINTLPDGNYKGNKVDEILIEPETVNSAGGLQEDATMHERGVPYRIGTSPGLDNLRITGTKDKTVTLTIEPGVTVKFLKGSAFKVEHYTGEWAAPALLVAVGTKEKPITFTSAEATPRAGDWMGLWFGGIARAENKLENVRIEYTGANCGCILLTCNSLVEYEGAVIFSQPPAAAFIKNSVIAHGTGHGIVHGYDGPGPDFAPSNTFEDLKGCTQTLPRMPTCPMPRPACGV